MKKYTNEIKKAAVELALHSKGVRDELPSVLGLKKSTLSSWISQYRNQVKVMKDNSIQEMIGRLQRENLSLKEERDLLKRAAAYFAKESS